LQIAVAAHRDFIVGRAIETEIEGKVDLVIAVVCASYPYRAAYCRAAGGNVVETEGRIGQVVTKDIRNVDALQGLCKAQKSKKGKAALHWAL
jgi:hypothetical protein